MGQLMPFPLTSSSQWSPGHMGLVVSFGTNLCLTGLPFQMEVSAGLGMVFMAYSQGPLLPHSFPAMYLFPLSLEGVQILII